MNIKIISAKRTPIGKFGGSLSGQDTTRVCSEIIKNMCSENNINKNDINLSVFGNVYSSGLGQAPARHISLEAGLPITSSSYLINMVCGSGMKAIDNVVQHVKLNGGIAIAGGFEFMSNVPYATLLNSRFSKKFGDFKMIDLLIHDGLIDSSFQIHMGVTAENIAKKFKISRKQQDDFAIFTKTRALKSIRSGYFDEEICPIVVYDHKGKKRKFCRDEFISSISKKQIEQLKPCFLKNKKGTVTPGNSSGINDGAAFLILASDDYCKKHNLKSNIEIVDCVMVGCDPKYMGLGPYYAINKILKNNHLDFKDIDVFEINEAFSAQILGCYKLLKKEYKVSDKYLHSKINLHGSGLGIGHPLGCTGARIVVTLYHHMLHNKSKYGIASLCVGGGMGIAILLKKDEKIK